MKRAMIVNVAIVVCGGESVACREDAMCGRPDAGSRRCGDDEFEQWLVLMAGMDDPVPASC
jgi:hypothetical protein